MRRRGSTGGAEVQPVGAQPNPVRGRRIAVPAQVGVGIDHPDGEPDRGCGSSCRGVGGSDAGIRVDHRRVAAGPEQRDGRQRHVGHAVAVVEYEHHVGGVPVHLPQHPGIGRGGRVQPGRLRVRHGTAVDPAVVLLPAAREQHRDVRPRSGDLRLPGSVPVAAEGLDGRDRAVVDSGGVGGHAAAEPGGEGQPDPRARRVPDRGEDAERVGVADEQDGARPSRCARNRGRRTRTCAGSGGTGGWCRGLGAGQIRGDVLQRLQRIRSGSGQAGQGAGGEHHRRARDCGGPGDRASHAHAARPAAGPDGTLQQDVRRDGRESCQRQPGRQQQRAGQSGSLGVQRQVERPVPQVQPVRGDAHEDERSPRQRATDADALSGRNSHAQHEQAG
jgi:hypothetical protein